MIAIYSPRCWITKRNNSKTLRCIGKPLTLIHEQRTIINQVGSVLRGRGIGEAVSGGVA